MNKHEDMKEAVIFCAVLIPVLVILISGLRMLESAVFLKGQATTESAERKTIVRDGIAYYPRQDLTTILVMGIDRAGPVKASGSYNNPGAADVIMLVICDETNETIRILAINRDSMAQVPVLGVDGKAALRRYEQLALAHTYGSGLEDSCENVRMAVEDFLGKIRIDHYAAVNMDAVAILNDAVGGVAVTVEDDFSGVDEMIGIGNVTLRGEQALSFVRSRKDVGDQLNLSRMKRQEEYVRGFAEALQAKLDEEDTFLMTAYEAVAPYMVTDISLNSLNSYAQRYKDYAYAGLVSPGGENVLKKGHYEFHADEEELAQLVLELFYEAK